LYPKRPRLPIERIGAAVAAALSALTLAGCANEGDADAGAVRLLTFREAEARPGQPAPTYHMASVSGRLTVRNGCLLLEAPGRSFALVFREGSAAYDAGRRFVTADGRGYAIGSEVRMGGSGGSAVASERPAEDAARCGAAALWYVTPRTMAPAAD
jgi:hypothetical protein